MPKNLKTLFGARVAKLRNIKGLSQEQLAELANISARMMSCIETGANFTQAETIEKIATALELNIQDLLRFENPDDKAEILDSINKKIDFIKDDPDKLRTLNEILEKFF